MLHEGTRRPGEELGEVEPDGALHQHVVMLSDGEVMKDGDLRGEGGAGGGGEGVLQSRGGSMCREGGVQVAVRGPLG